VVASHAGADGMVVRALQSVGVDGLVVAATGNGTVHRDLEAALLAAQAAGIAVLRSTRCAEGSVSPKPSDTLPAAEGLTPAQARVELMLRCLA
jgi:L-asparaginase